MTEPSRTSSGREPLPEKRDPTHVLRLEIPLHIGEGQTFYFDPLRDALRTTLALSRLATIGVICGDPMVTMEEPP